MLTIVMLSLAFNALFDVVTATLHITATPIAAPDKEGEEGGDEA